MQFGGKLLHWFMGQAAQHHVAEIVCLLLDGLGQLWVFVAVNHTPPGGNGINQLLVGGVKMNAVGVQNFVGLAHIFHLLIRIPNHFNHLVNKFTI